MTRQEEINLRLTRINETLSKQHEEITELRGIVEKLYVELHRKQKKISALANSKRQITEECRNNIRSKERTT